MCGFAGLFLPRDAKIVEADLDAMIGALRHRGPDGTKRYVSDDRRYQAGFARLAIIDLATGDQPIVDRGGERVLMGNGEIYNYVELREQLAPTGYRFRTRGDMEVVLPLIDRDGPGFVDRLNGMYALAIYENAPHQITLVRDRLGIKPLYWAQTREGGILFASEIKALFASGLIEPAVDEAAVSSYLAHGYVPAPDTLYRGVRKLPPGHRLTVFADGAIRFERYWRPLPADGVPAQAGELREHLVSLMRDALRLQLRSDVPLGAMLSGGIDSGLTVALASAALDRPLNTYTVRFEGAPVDETPLAAEVASRYGAAHTEFDLASGEAGSYLPRLAWYADEPLADASLLPNYMIAEVLGRSVKVVLNGTGGDELFAGYPRYFRRPVERAYLLLSDRFRKGYVEPVVRVASPMTAWKLARAESFNDNRGRYLYQHSTLFPPPMRALIGNRMTPPRPRQESAFEEFMRDSACDAQTGGLAAEMQSYLPEDLLTLLDRTSMAVGVEGRVPLLDHRLVEAALAVPEAIRTPRRRQKGLERDIARDFLPDSVIKAPKQGFASPISAWLKAGLAPMARRLLTRPETLERGWWTARGIDKLLARPERHGARIYALVMLELATRIHVEGSTARTVPSAGLEEFADAA